MAAFNRPTEATYEIHEKVTVDTKGERRWNEWATEAMFASMFTKSIYRYVTDYTALHGAHEFISLLLSLSTTCMLFFTFYRRQ
jgi:hypothetical protein